MHIDAALGAIPENKKPFKAILRNLKGIVGNGASERMTMLNILPRILPVFRRWWVRCNMIIPRLHVDQHTLQVTFAILRRFHQCRSMPKNNPLATD